MSNRVLVVEANLESFEQWHDPQYGLGAHLEALGQDSSQVSLERIGSRDDLLAVAHDVNTSEHLPARALVFEGVNNGLGIGEPESDLAQDPVDQLSWEPRIEKPADYDRRRDPTWVSKGRSWLANGDASRPLTPYARLISSRLIQRAVPDVRYYVTMIEEDESQSGIAELFEDLSEFGGTRFGRGRQPDYGEFLARINRHAAITGQDFMSLVDGVGEKRGDDARYQIKGTDIDAIRGEEGMQPLVGGPRLQSYNVGIERINTITQIGLVARMLTGEYPGASSEDAELVLPRGGDLSLLSRAFRLLAA